MSCTRSKEADLDSYQDRDSTYLHDEWRAALLSRKDHLIKQINEVTQSPNANQSASLT